MDHWYEKTYLWGQTNLTEDDPVHTDLEFWKTYWKKTGVQGIIINCGGIVSYYHSNQQGQYRAKYLKDGEDYFGVWLKAARQAGLRVIARMDIQTTTEDLYLAHPDWYCVDREGAPILSQGRYMTCVNGGYYGEFIPDVFREVIGRFHPDGFADNSWAGAGNSTICYCRNCREKFRSSYGLELPEKADWNDPVYRKWIRWSYGTRVQNWKYFNRITKEASGGDCYWFGMLHADDVTKYSGRFRVLVLPNVAILTPAQEDQILRFLKEGKGLVMTGCTGLYDEEGEKRSDRSRLWEYLGICHENEQLGCTISGDETWMRHEGHNYLALPDERHEIFSGFDESELLPLGGSVQKVRTEGALVPAASYIPEFPIYPPEMAWIRERKDDIGTVFAGELPGKARVVYLAADIDRSYGQYRVPDQGRVLENAVRYVAGGRFPVTVKSHGHIHCEAYKQEGDLIIHLVNLIGCEVPVGTLTENIPSGPVEVLLNDAPDGDCTALGLVEKKKWPVRTDGDGWKIVLPIPGRHEILVIRDYFGRKKGKE